MRISNAFLLMLELLILNLFISSEPPSVNKKAIFKQAGATHPYG